MAVTNLPPDKVFIAYAGHIAGTLHIYYPRGPVGSVDVSVNHQAAVNHQISAGETVSVPVNGQWVAVFNGCVEKVQLLYTTIGEALDVDGSVTIEKVKELEHAGDR